MKPLVIALVLAGVILVAVPVSAHHSFAMFDMTREVTYAGTITEWKWQNPHVHFTVFVTAGPGVNRRRWGPGTWKAAPSTSWGARAGTGTATRSAIR